MSYSRTYTGQITISGSKTVSYPKSDSGGTMTVDYHATENVNVTIDVDTERFDHNVGQCNVGLDVLTGSVVAMNAAQCAEICESSKRISGTIIDGFYGMIRSELSQQMVDLKNRFESQQLLLLQLGKRMQEYQSVMEADYTRIASRYGALFGELDKECQRRVTVLDKKSFDLSVDGYSGRISEPVLDGAGKTIVFAIDIARAQSGIATSRLRSRTSAAMNVMLDYIRQEDELSAGCSSMVQSCGVTDRKTLFCPCVYVETDSLADENANGQTVFVPERFSDMSDQFLAAFDAADRESLIAWQDLVETDRETLNSEIERLLMENASGTKSAETEGQEYVANGSDRSRRIGAMIKNLWSEGSLRDVRNAK